MRYTKKQRRFAIRMTRRAAARASAKGDPFLNQQELWILMVEASRKPKKGK